MSAPVLDFPLGKHRIVMAWMDADLAGAHRL